MNAKIITIRNRKPLIDYPTSIKNDKLIGMNEESFINHLIPITNSKLFTE